MTTSIIPPPELVQEWVDIISHRSDQKVPTMATEGDADQELEECCEWLAAAIELYAEGKNGSLIIRALKQLDD